MQLMKTRKLTLFLWCLTVCFCLAASCLAQTRDFWLKAERKGKGYGYEHVTIRQVENGNFEYYSDSHVKMDIAGINPQDIIQQGTYIINANLMPISFEFHYQSRTKNMKLIGKYDNGLMDLTVEDENGEIHKREIPFQETYFEVVLGDLILKHEEKKNFHLRIFDPASLRVDSVWIEITKSDAKQVEATITDILTRKYHIDRQGRITQIEFVELHSRAYLTDAEDAQNIDYLSTADGYTLTVKSQRSFPNVYKVAAAQIQVKWEGIPFEEFDFEDNRQRVIRKASAQGEYEVNLEITKATPVSKGITAPIVDEKFAAFLKDTEYIKPNDPTIQQQVAEIRGNDKDAFTIVQNLLRWISANIKADVIYETLTGPEVLKKRRGKCSEYAILFASLARAAGIPAKLVLGELNSGDQWVGHMWNEVWLGDWMAVDAAAGTFITGPSHVKFVDSPSLMGTQRLRTKLVDNLKLEILDFTEEKIETPAEMKTGISDDTYFNQAFACKISAPETTWVINEKVEATHTSVMMKPKEENVTFALILFAVPPGISAKTILDGRLNAIAAMVKDFKKLEEGEIELAGQKAPRVVFQQAANDQLILVNENCLLVDGANAYLFAFITPDDRFAQLRTSFQKILESFKIVK